MHRIHSKRKTESNQKIKARAADRRQSRKAAKDVAQERRSQPQLVSARLNEDGYSYPMMIR